MWLILASSSNTLVISCDIVTYVASFFIQCSQIFYSIYSVFSIHFNVPVPDFRLIRQQKLGSNWICKMLHPWRSIGSWVLGCELCARRKSGCRPVTLRSLSGTSIECIECIECMPYSPLVAELDYNKDLCLCRLMHVWSGTDKSWMWKRRRAHLNWSRPTRPDMTSSLSSVSEPCYNRIQNPVHPISQAPGRALVHHFGCSRKRSGTGVGARATAGKVEQRTTRSLVEHVEHVELCKVWRNSTSR